MQLLYLIFAYYTPNQEITCKTNKSIIIMKKLKQLGFLMILASSLLFIGCTHEPYIAADGVDGADGSDGVDGADTSAAACIECHSDTFRDPIRAEYDISGHAIGTSWARGTSASCAACHNNQGYIDYFSGIYGDDDGNPSANPDGYSVSSAINCSGCHDDHRSFDFENDGQDYALRNIDPIQLMVDEDYFIDMGFSNACVMCHQPRRSGPEDDGNGEFLLTSSHWGPHHGPQSTMLEGLQGVLIPGSLGYPGIGTATHRTSASCISCHMGETTDLTEGGHTWRGTESACVTCHTSGVPTEAEGLMSDMNLLVTLLENVIGWEYEYEVDEDGELVEDENGDPIIVLDENGDPVILEVHGIIHDGHPNNGSFGEGATFPILAAEAAWNYLFIYEDNSGGIHNPDYAKALIRNSKEALD